MLHELRYALRRLRRSPGFALTAIVTLALAIGVTTAMFGVVDALLLRPLPFPSPDRLVMVWTEVPGEGVREGRSAFASVETWRQHSRSFEDLAVLDPVSATLTVGGEREQIGVSRVSPNLFTLLGVAPERGRVFTAREADDRQRLAVISHRFWQIRFGGSPAAIGASLIVDGQPSQIVGVLPESFARAFGADLFEPHTLFADWPTRRAASGRGSWFVVGRLRASAPLDDAQRELAAIAGRPDATRPGDVQRSVRIVPLSETLTGPNSRIVVWMLTGAALLLWLVAAVNVAGLALARGLGRVTELAIQAAIGASRGRLVRSLLAESVAVATIAGVLGLGIAAAATRAIRTVGPAYVPRLQEVELDLRVFVAAALVSAATGLLVGLAPAVSVWRRGLRVTGADGGRATASSTGTRLRRLFVVGECAAAIVLLAGAGLLVRSWWNVSRVDPGFRPEGVAAMGLRTPVDMPPGQRAAFYDAVLDRVAALPGVDRVGISSELFVGNVAEQIVTAEGGDMAAPQPLQVRRDEIAGEIFDAIGAPLLRGRRFTAADGRGPAQVAIINATMASRLWPGRDAVGRRFALGPAVPEPAWFTVVGVVGDMRRQGLETAPVPQMFEPIAQAPSRGVILFVRTSAPDPMSRAAAVRAAVRSVDPQALVYGGGLVTERFGSAIAERRFQSALVMGCAALALLLSTVGLYGLVQYSVVSRTHEIGVRMALGARGADIGRMIVGEGLALALAGLLVGLAGAWWLARAASTLLFGVGAADPLTLAGVSALGLVVAASASYLPARRAARIAPIIALQRRVV